MRLLNIGRFAIVDLVRNGNAQKIRTPAANPWFAADLQPALQKLSRGKNRDAVLSASLLRRTVSRFDYYITRSDLVADYSEVREVQVVGARAIEVDPALDHVAVSRIDSHSHCGRTVGRHSHAVRHGDSIVACAQDSSVKDARDSAPEGIRSELRL